MSTNQINRRQHERFRVNPGYTSTSVRVHPDETEFTRTGHIYDLSEGGIQFELDCPIEPGSTVSMQINLPGLGTKDDIGPGRAIFITGNVIWVNMDEPGASRMALAITRFDREGDKDRLIRALSTSRFLRAA
jgi:hypothetical protein